MSARVGSTLTILVAAAVLVACSGTGSTPPPQSSPSGRPSVTPRPTAAPVAVADVFFETINDKSFGAYAVVTGSAHYGAADIRLSGEMTVSGQDMQMLMTATMPGGAEISYERVDVDGDSYRRADDGRWMLLPEGNPNTGAVIGGFDFASLRTAGTERVGGQTVHRLIPVGGTPLTLEFFGLDDPTVQGFESSLEFLATADGTPFRMDISGTWRQVYNTELVEAGMDLTFAFERVGGYLSVRSPEQPWVSYTSSELGYTMAHPVGWTVEFVPADAEYPAYDLLLAPTDGEVHVVRHGDIERGLPLNAWYQASAASIEQSFEVTVSQWDEATLAGEPAALYRAHYEDGGTIFLIVATTVIDGVGWDVVWFSRAGGEESDRQLFAEFLSSFALGE